MGDGIRQDGVAPLPGAQPPAKKSSVSPVVIILGCVGCGCVAFVVVAIVAAIAIPNLLASRAAANEFSAIASLRMYCGAQNIFHRTDYDGDGALEYCGPSNPEATSFSHLSTTAVDGEMIYLIDSAMAAATSPETARSGYYFVDIAAGSDGKAYDATRQHGLCAVPANYGSSGLNTFVIDDSGILYQKDNGGRPVTEFPQVEGIDSGWIICE